MKLDFQSEGKHYEGSVYHIIDVIGTVGGIFELVSNAIMIVYLFIHKDLYMHSILTTLSKTRKQNAISSLQENKSSNMNRRIIENDLQEWKTSENKQLLSNHDSPNNNTIPRRNLNANFEREVNKIKSRTLMVNQHLENHVNTPQII